MPRGPRCVNLAASQPPAASTAAPSRDARSCGARSHARRRALRDRRIPRRASAVHVNRLRHALLTNPRARRLQLGHQPALADRSRPRSYERGRGALLRGDARAHARGARAPQHRSPRPRMGVCARRSRQRGRLATVPAALREAVRTKRLTRAGSIQSPDWRRVSDEVKR
jgi:hypothetical protein